MLHQYGLIVSNDMFIGIIIKVHHNKRLATTDLSGQLCHCGLVKGRCIRVLLNSQSIPPRTTA